MSTVPEPATSATPVSVSVPSPVGLLTLVSDGTRLTSVWFVEHRHAPAESTLGTRVELAEAPQVLRDAASQLAEYFAGERTCFELPLGPEGTDFQHRVWGQLRQIPYGTTLSYGDLARRLGRPGAARAVGLANGRNPLSIVVPCHRVIGADGSITGYGGGVERKRWLLDLERGADPGTLW